MIASLALLLALQHVVPVAAAAPGTTPITTALASAASGDTLLIPAGEYREPTIVVTRPVTLIGQSGTILDGEGLHEILVVTANGVTVRGITFRHTGFSYSEDRAALRMAGASDCTILDNRFEDTFFAIYLAGAAHCLVADNAVIGAGRGSEVGTGSGIHLWSSRDVVVRHNIITGHRDGIYLEFSHHTTVADNLSENNARYGLHFMYSDSSEYRRNRFIGNGSGVAVMYTRVVVMRDNLFAEARGGTAYGLLLKEIRDARLTGNTFRNNTTALLADGADGIEAVGNHFDNNGWAIRLLGSTAVGRFEGNLFAGNSFDVAVTGDGGQVRFDGNWWDSYRGWDLDRDGVGDVAYHPVRLFALLVEHAPPVLLLQRALFVRLLDAAERVLPVLTPRAVADRRPMMHPPIGMRP